jgi:sugar phosphate permease
MPVCGFLIASVGWESVFYVTGVVGLVWSVIWFFVVFDSPAQHPRISQEERRYIENAIGEATSHGKVHVEVFHVKKMRFVVHSSTPIFSVKVVRRLFGPKRDEVTGEWRRLHNKELHALDSSPTIIRRTK